MRRRVLSLLVAIATLAVFSPVAFAAPGIGTPVIVVFRDGADAPGRMAEALGRAHGFAPGHVYQHALRGFAATVPAGRLAALRADPRVAYVELDQVAHTTDQAVPTGISRIFAPGNAEIDIDGSDDWRVDVDVAVIDTGIDLDHPDLNVFRSTNCSGGGPFTKSCLSGGDDDNGHGSHVAGSIGALDNGMGVVGVAPGARLWAVKVLSSSGSGYLNWVIAGIDYVAANAGAIEVANMSLGCECPSTAMDTAIANAVSKGVVFAVAAGNSDKDTSTFHPAAHPDVISVSALADFNGLPGGGAAPTCRADQDDTLADFSNWGATVEIAAPGVCILSTWMGGGYQTISGTSMASPHAAGAAALLASRNNPNSKADTQAVRTTLMNNGNLNWTDDSGDGIKEPLLDVSNASVFDPILVAGSGGGGGGNAAPVAINDAYSVTVGQTLDVAAPGVLGNDTDADGNSLTAILVSGVSHGTLNFNSNGSFSYTPSSSDADTSFTYRANDGAADSNTATVSITVNPASPGNTMHVGDLDRSATSSGNNWRATVTVTVHDASHNPVSGATVSFTWSGGYSASGSCVTTASGSCSATTGSIHKRNGSVTYTVTNVTHSSLTYQSSANHDPDGDSTGTSITVAKP
jgi:subtilisin family serine protease